MKRRLLAFQASTAVLLVISAVSVARAQTITPAWRCGGDGCQEHLINDIEDKMQSTWPSSLNLTPPGMPYTCTTYQATARQTTSGQVPWTVTVASQLPSFLLGRTTASADVVGTLQVSSDGSTWPGTSIHDLFQGTCTVADGVIQCTDVLVTEGDTGVSDLGALELSIPGGSFWTSSVNFRIAVNDARIAWCDVGYPGHVMRVTPPSPARSLELSYPITWTPVQALLEAAVRDQFRQAVAAVVLGF